MTDTIEARFLLAGMRIRDLYSSGEFRTVESVTISRGRNIRYTDGGMQTCGPHHQFLREWKDTADSTEDTPS